MVQLPFVPSDYGPGNKEACIGSGEYLELQGTYSSSLSHGFTERPTGTSDPATRWTGVVSFLEHLNCMKKLQEVCIARSTSAITIQVRYRPSNDINEMARLYTRVSCLEPGKIVLALLRTG